MILAEFFYIAACAAAPDGGIYSYVVKDGCVRQVAFTSIANANYMAFSADKKIMYVSVAGKGNGGVASFKVNGDGTLSVINQRLAPKMGACHLTVAPAGNFLFAANYSEGNVAQYPVKDGVIGECSGVFQHEGKSANARRQASPHAHCTIISPDGKYLCVVDLGIDAIKAYGLSDKGISTEDVKTSPVLPPGSGPRHLVFDKAGKNAYVITELGNTVVSMQYNEGVFTNRQVLSTLPAAFKGVSWGAAIRLDPSGKFLLASNRGYDSIAAYRILEDGLMAPSGLTLCGGSYPRDFNFLPGGKKIAVGHELTNNVFFFDYDAATGTLTPDGNVLNKLPRPIAILW